MKFGSVARFCSSCYRNLRWVNLDELKRTNNAVAAKRVLLDSFLKMGDQRLTKDEWNELELSLPSFSGRFDSIMMSICFNNKSPSLADSLIDYIGDMNLKITAMSKYISLQSLCPILSPDCRKRILKFYKLIRMNDTLPPDVLVDLTLGMSKLNDIEQCNNLIKKLYAYGSNVSQALCMAIDILIENENINGAFELLHTFREYNCLPCHVEVLTKFLPKINTTNDLKRILSYMEEFYVLPNPKFLENLKSCCLRLTDIDVVITSPDPRGKCKGLNHTLSDITLSDSEFDCLKKEVITKHIVGTDVFLHSSARELKDFEKFIDGKKYDLVVDLLNLFYNLRQLELSQFDKMNNLIDTLLKKFDRIFIISKNHLGRSFTGKEKKRLKTKADFFFTDNTTKDDKYILYACMSSGPHTFFVTQDRFRDHKSILNEDNRELFRRWCLTRQLFFYPSATGIIFIPPITYDLKVQNKEGAWFVPCMKQANPSGTLEIPTTWLVLRDKTV